MPRFRGVFSGLHTSWTRAARFPRWSRSRSPLASWRARHSCATVTALLLAVCIVFLSNSGRGAAESTSTEQDSASFETGFTQIVEPFLRQHCLECHGPTRTEAKLDLSSQVSLHGVAEQHGLWKLILERLQAGEMPPETALRQPSDTDRAAVVDWILAFRDHEARLHAGDPGIVPARRLSNAELDYTIRDLTGVDLRPTREFPVDPANEAGFDNSADSLATSPALARKYLEAARWIADHLLLKPEGFVFAPHSVVADTDRDKYCVKRIVDFYERCPTDLAEYFLAAWQFQHRESLGRSNAALDEFAHENGLSMSYLATITMALTETCEHGPLADLQARWRQLGADVQREDEARQACRELRDYVSETRQRLVPPVEKLHVNGISDGSQPLVLWRNRQLAAQRRRCAPGVEPNASERAAWERFCEVFPDAFYLSQRAAYFDANVGKQGRLLTAGFHLMQGYFRDDAPLCELILDEQGRQELDELWRELDFVALAPLRQYKDFIFFERAEPPRFMQEAAFDFARSEDKDCTTQVKIDRLAEAYLAKARKQAADERALEAMQMYFAEISASIRWVEQAQRKAEPSHLAALVDFASRAFRRPLTRAEQEDLPRFYHALRSQEQLSHEDALRDVVASVLLSPHFCFHLVTNDSTEPSDQAGRAATDGDNVRPLPPYALASRLSYFLWSSMPDDQLLARAAARELHQPQVITAEARRMLADERARGLATEFAGNWLDFRRFEEHNAVDRARFASFTPALRSAMFEEPIRFFLNVIAEDRSVLDFLAADHTFVNSVLAAHYGISIPGLAEDQWVRVDDARQYGRGGFLPMSIFLTKNSPGLRTSPVKRGYWVVRRLLDERIPAPPPGVPELPADEAGPGDLSLPKLLARHREDKNCASCHARFDSIGLALEGYGPIGERRELDLGGRPVEATGSFPDGQERTGLEGLRRYLCESRQDEFLDNLCRKLFSFALGRTLLLSDEPTIEKMRADLADHDYRFGSLIESIVTSSQFLNRRVDTEQAARQDSHSLDFRPSLHQGNTE